MLILDKVHSVVRNRIQAMGGRRREHTIDGQHVHAYEVEGTGHGPPIVLVHGLGASSHSFFPVLRGLRSKWSRIYLPDLPGHGFSRAGEPLDIRGQQEIFRGYLDQVVREPAALVGNSMGGAIVLQTAIERPQTKAVALLSPAGAPLTEEDIRRLQHGFGMETRAKAIDFFNRLTHRQTPLGWLIAADLMETFRVPAIQHILKETQAVEHFEPHLLRALEMPILLIWGQSEKILPAEGVHYFRKVLPPHARIEIWEKCGHLPMMEQPRRTLALLNELASAVAQRLPRAQAM